MTTNIIKRNNGTSGLPATRANSWVDQLLNNSLNRFFNDDIWGFREMDHEAVVPVNLRETEKTYEMELVAPGLRKDDFRIQASNDMLTVSLEMKKTDNQENPSEGWLRREYRLTAFTRSFSLDDTVDVNKISATYKEGILHLTLPKKEHAQKLSKTIEIK